MQHPHYYWLLMQAEYTVALAERVDEFKQDLMETLSRWVCDFEHLDDLECIYLGYVHGKPGGSAMHRHEQQRRNGHLL